jgi:hypothetical protein
MTFARVHATLIFSLFFRFVVDGVDASQDAERMYNKLGGTAAVTNQDKQAAEELPTGGSSEEKPRDREGQLEATLARALGHLYLHDVASAKEVLGHVDREAEGLSEGDEQADSRPNGEVSNPELRSLIRKLRIAIADEVEALARVGASAA